MNKITTQIKLIGFSLSIIAIALVLLTLFLNQRSKNDANVVNIAGKERMLTQKMAKELFLDATNKNGNFREFEAAKKEFLINLDSLMRGNTKDGITPPPTEEIRGKLISIKQKSDEFLALCEQIKSGETGEFTTTQMYDSNNALLSMIDDTVSEYAAKFEAKRERLEALQYCGGALILIAVLMSMYLTRKIETKFDKFLSETKEIGALKCDDTETAYNISTDSGELDQAKSELKSFMDKVEKVVSKAQKALDESQNAIAELETSAKIMEGKLHSEELDEEVKKEMESYIDKSEDITISSLEDIATTKEMLQKFRGTLAEINKKIT
jgi:nitrate/nitrite-specific signal transduction histidine kinase